MSTATGGEAMPFDMTREEITQRGLAVHPCRGCGVAIALLRTLTAPERKDLENWWGSPGYQQTGPADAWCPGCWYDCFGQGVPPLPPPPSVYVENDADDPC